MFCTGLSAESRKSCGASPCFEHLFECVCHLEAVTDREGKSAWKGNPPRNTAAPTPSTPTHMVQTRLCRSQRPGKENVHVCTVVLGKPPKVKLEILYWPHLAGWVILL